MELAKGVISGIADMQNSNVLPEETVLQLLDIAVSYICRNTNDIKSIGALYPSKSDVVKAAVANVSCLFVEAARHDYDEECLKSFLQHEHITGQRTEKLCSVYMNNKLDIQSQLESIGDNVPHIVDIDWRLHHCVKVSTRRSVSMPIYNIRLGTKKANEIKYVTFACTIQQLQELVYKLKDIVRHIEKMSNV